MSVTDFRHPLGAGEMSVVYKLGALGFARWVKPKNDGNNLVPIGAFSVGIQEPDVSRQMALVIGIDAVGLRRTIFKWGNAHLRISSGYLTNGKTFLEMPCAIPKNFLIMALQRLHHVDKAKCTQVSKAGIGLLSRASFRCGEMRFVEWMI